MNVADLYLEVVRKRFRELKVTAERTFVQLDEEMWFWRSHEGMNSIAMLVNHLRGNMLSRWTDFLTTDGEKATRQRDLEFEPVLLSSVEVMAAWEEGWALFLGTLEALQPDDLQREVLIRGERHTVMDAIERQVVHYANHIGQIIFIAKQLKSDSWVTLTIPKRSASDRSSH